MKLFTRACDAMLSLVAPKITARAACSETTRECYNTACGNGGIRRCCRTCTWGGNPCHRVSCTGYSCGLCALP